MKIGKCQGNYTIVPPIKLNQIVDIVVKEGNLKHISDWYENCDENRKRALEEAIVEYMNVYSKALIELSSMISKGLYEILDARRHMTHIENEIMKESIRLC